jgi:lantibiotic modifying enzyme
VHGGVAGPLAVLVRAATVHDDPRLRDAVAIAARWLDQHLFDVPRILPGLYFGRSGTAWALYDAARLLDDDKLATRAVELLTRTPVSWPSPDVTHGLAGAGLAHLWLWARTGDPILGERAGRYADGVLVAEERDGGPRWRLPAPAGSASPAASYLGFAHGAAGIGAFLLGFGAQAGDAGGLTGARRVGDMLCDAAITEGPAAWWPTGLPEDGDLRQRHWCHGSSGVGTFLIRLWAVTGEPRYRAAAEAAGAAVHRDAWYTATTTVCHGLAGDGEFLLDLADFTGEPCYRDRAAELAGILHTRHTVRGGRRLLPDDTGTEVSVGYGLGLSGVLGFLLRLRHGGPRWWMPDRTPSGPVPGYPTSPEGR